MCTCTQMHVLKYTSSNTHSPTLCCLYSLILASAGLRSLQLAQPVESLGEHLYASQCLLIMPMDLNCSVVLCTKEYVKCIRLHASFCCVTIHDRIRRYFVMVSPFQTPSVHNLCPGGHCLRKPNTRMNTSRSHANMYFPSCSSYRGHGYAEDALMSFRTRSVSAIPIRGRPHHAPALISPHPRGSLESLRSLGSCSNFRLFSY